MVTTVYKEGAFGIISGTPYACLEELRSQGIYNSSKVIGIAPSNHASVKDIMLFFWGGAKMALSDVINWFKFNETSGTSTYDQGSAMQTATLVSGAFFNTGMDSVISGVGALCFSGVDAKLPWCISGHVTIPANSSTVGDTGTISVWVKPTTGMTGVNKEQVIYEVVPHHMDGTTPTQTSYLRVFLSDTNAACYDFRNHQDTYGTNHMCISGGNVTVNSWNHIAVTSDGSHVRLYLNGEFQEEGTSATLSGSNTGQWTGDLTVSGTYSRNIGYHNISGTIGNHFTGYLDNMRIANRAFTAEEAKQLYDAGL